MVTMTLDTHRAVKNLEEAGMGEHAAEAVVSLVSSAFTENVASKSDISDMATKADIAEMATKSDIAELRSEFRSEIRELDARMTVRFVWMALGIVVITTSLTSGIVGILNQLQG